MDYERSYGAHTDKKMCQWEDYEVFFFLSLAMTQMSVLTPGNLS